MLGFRRAPAVLALASLLMGCDPSESDSLLAADVERLSMRHACADILLIAADDDASEGLFLSIDDGLVDQVIDSGEPVQGRYEVDDERVELRWVTGRNVYAGHCGLDNGEPWQVDSVEQAIVGEILVELEPSSEGPILAVELRDVLLSPVDVAQAKHADSPTRALPPTTLEQLVVAR